MLKLMHCLTLLFTELRKCYNYLLERFHILPTKYNIGFFGHYKTSTSLLSQNYYQHAKGKALRNSEE